MKLIAALTVLLTILAACGGSSDTISGSGETIVILVPETEPEMEPEIPKEGVVITNRLLEVDLPSRPTCPSSDMMNQFTPRSGGNGLKCVWSCVAVNAFGLQRRAAQVDAIYLNLSGSLWELGDTTIYSENECNVDS